MFQVACLILTLFCCLLLVVSVILVMLLAAGQCFPSDGGMGAAWPPQL
jgi:hypothetical protein